MKRKISPFFSFLLTATVAGVGPTAWSQDTVNFVRDTARFVVVDGFGTDNEINNFATDTDRFDSGLSFSEFQTRLRAAYAAGLGGVINFDNPVYGSAFVDADRSGVRRFIEQAEDDLINQGVVMDTQLERQEFINAARADAYAAGVVDLSVRIPIIARSDRGLNDADLLPQREQVFFQSMVALFGPNRDRQLILRQGPQNYTEGGLATRNHPGSEALDSLVNDGYPWWVGRSGYSGGNMRAMSQPFSFNPGMLDMVIDPKDNVTALGFVLLSVNNFQYWQGLGGTPDNAENIRVLVEFSNGTSDLLTSTTAQSVGGWDTFFAIGAPADTSITRLKVRIVGRNWRTFVLMDDLAFVTAPAPPFLASAPTFSGSAGSPLYYLARFGQSPTSVSVSGLPAGLTFDPASGVISGTPVSEGTVSATFTLSNAVGTVEETVEFVISAPAAEDAVPVVTNAAELAGSVTLGQMLTPITVETSRDEIASPGELSFFTVVYRVSDDGSRSIVPLESLGLGLGDGVLSGTPLLPGAVGLYEIEVYVFNASGGDRAVLFLEILPIVPGPNFDGNELTDLLWWNSSTGQLHVLLAEGNFFDSTTDTFGVRSGWSAINTGLTATNPAHLAVGDFDLNNQTDLSVFRAGEGRLDMVFFDPDMALRPAVVNDLNTSWTLQMTGDMRGDGFTSYLWKNPADARYAVWHTEGSEVVWGGFLFTDGRPRELLLHADFSGDGTRELLFRLGPNLFKLVDPSIGTSTLSISSSVEFSMPSSDWVPHLSTDLTGNGTSDLIWKNRYSGEVSIWIMSGPSVPDTAREPPDFDEMGEVLPPPPGPIRALPGEPLLPFGSPLEVITAIDVNEDQNRDLILQNRQTGDLYLLLMSGSRPLGNPIPLNLSTPYLQVEAAGDFNANKREDLLVRDPVTGRTHFLLMGPSGIVASEELGVFAGNIEFISLRPISTDLSLPPGRDDAIAPWQGAFPLGDRWFSSPWFGLFWDPAEGFIFHAEHGFQRVFGESADEGIWLYDQNLEWLWTNSQTYPWLFFPRFESWIYFAAGSVIPNRWFFESANFVEWVMESDL